MVLQNGPSCSSVSSNPQGQGVQGFTEGLTVTMQC